VRVKDTGELRMLRADQLIAGPALAANAPPAAAPAPRGCASRNGAGQCRQRSGRERR